MVRAEEGRYIATPELIEPLIDENTIGELADTVSGRRWPTVHAVCKSCRVRDKKSRKKRGNRVNRHHPACRELALKEEKNSHSVTG